MYYPAKALRMSRARITETFPSAARDGARATHLFVNPKGRPDLLLC